MKSSNLAFPFWAMSQMWSSSKSPAPARLANLAISIVSCSILGRPAAMGIARPSAMQQRGPSLLPGGTCAPKLLIVYLRRCSTRDSHRISYNARSILWLPIPAVGRPLLCLSYQRHLACDSDDDKSRGLTFSWTPRNVHQPIRLPVSWSTAL